MYIYRYHICINQKKRSYIYEKHVEDVNLYYGLVDDTVGINLFSYYDSQFKWDLPEESSSENNSKNEQKPPILPNTGDVQLIIIASIITVLVVCAIIFKKKSKLK